MTAGCNLFKVLLLIVLISAFILKTSFFFFLSFLERSTLQTTDQTAWFWLCPNVFSPPAVHNPNILIPEPQTKRYHEVQRLEGTATQFAEAECYLVPTDLKIRSSTRQHPHIPHCSSKLAGTWSSSSATQKPVMGTLCVGRKRHFTAGSKPSPTLLRDDQS